MVTLFQDEDLAMADAVLRLDVVPAVAMSVALLREGTWAQAQIDIPVTFRIPRGAAIAVEEPHGPHRRETQANAKTKSVKVKFTFVIAAGKPGI